MDNKKKQTKDTVITYDGGILKPKATAQTKKKKKKNLK